MRAEITNKLGIIVYAERTMEKTTQIDAMINDFI